jgi:K+-sensing histidine kinase KdpD
MKNERAESFGVAAAGAGAAIMVAAALVPVRDTLGGANVALILVLLVVAMASLGGRLAGATTGLAASVAFNFFHTKPYLTVRIDSARDVATVVLIMAVGLAVGELGVARSRQSATRRSHLRSIRALEDVGALVSAGVPTEVVWPAVQHALSATLGARHTTFETATRLTPLPLVERDGRVDELNKQFRGNGFVLPARGAALAVEADGRLLGQLVVAPDPDLGVTREQRRAAVAIADQFALALRREPRITALS